MNQGAGAGKEEGSKYIEMKMRVIRYLTPYLPLRCVNQMECGGETFKGAGGVSVQECSQTFDISNNG